ncbi:DUF899 domain-containing protein [Bacillus sp. SD088]|uniref:DUF899 domain-containing protein n=1 Tax=Bacillus sp. SD088 TaxID=2782012 RepID=UPI001A97D047|nr:DUF899 domain-containing protein [Bacillus sp. SD088]
MNKENINLAKNKIALPKVVSQDEWLTARKELLVKEKEARRAQDGLAAERRRLPMVRIDKDYAFEGPDGKASLLDLFDGRRQLIVYHFMLEPGSDHRCPGCSFLVDNIGHLAHMHARDTTLVLVSRAPLSQIKPYKRRMGWTVPWYSSYGTDFNYDFGATHEGGEQGGVSVFLWDNDHVFHTYHTTDRGTDILFGTYNWLDMTPFGRQEDWEDSPEGWPQTPRYEWWRLHDEYDHSKGSDSCCNAGESHL